MPPPVRAKKRDDFYRDRRRRKVCAFCADKTVQIDYKEVNRLRRYLSERAKIEPRRKTGHLCRTPARAGRRAQAGPPRRPAPVRAAAPPPVVAGLDRGPAVAPAPRLELTLLIVGLLMLGGGAAAGVVRFAARSRRRRPDRAAADPRLRPAAARGGRRLADLRDHDQQRRGRRLPRAPRGQPAPRA